MNCFKILRAANKKADNKEDVDWGKLKKRAHEKTFDETDNEKIKLKHVETDNAEKERLKKGITEVQLFFNTLLKSCKSFEHFGYLIKKRAMSGNIQ